MPDPALLPLPRDLALRPGGLRLAGPLRIAVEGAGGTDPRLERALQRFARRLGDAIPRAAAPAPDLVAPGGAADLVVRCAAGSAPHPALGDDESYTLAVDSSGARLDAPCTWGALHGLETLAQLAASAEGGGVLRAAEIRDAPRFPWRGIMLDSARHFVPAPVVERILDAMAAVKLNVLHWHLTDNEGFRVESLRHPRLHEVGSGGAYHPQEEVRQLVARAADRGIRVVPELDVPGHTLSWLAAYPELGSRPGASYEPGSLVGYAEALDPTREEVYAFLDSLFGEMGTLFPDRHFHVGGDEVWASAWRENPAIRAFMAERGMRRNADLQAHFSARVVEIAARHGKVAVGWEEMAGPGLPDGVVLQTWRALPIRPAVAAHPNLVSAGYYLDHFETAAEHYAVDPLRDGAAGLDPEQRSNVVGGEACLWTETADAQSVEMRLWPRAAAVAERLWSRADATDAADLYRRLDALSLRLERRGSRHRASRAERLARLAGGAPSAPLETLADAVRPVFMFHLLAPRGPGEREEGLPDVALADPPAARLGAARVEAFLADPRDAAARDALVAELERLRDNHEALRPLLEARPQLAGAIPLSERLRDLAALGLEAVAALASRRPVSPERLRAQEELLAASRGLDVLAGAGAVDLDAFDAGGDVDLAALFEKQLQKLAADPSPPLLRQLRFALEPALAALVAAQPRAGG